MRVTKRIEDHVAKTVRAAYAERLENAGKQYEDDKIAANRLLKEMAAKADKDIKEALAKEFPGFIPYGQAETIEPRFLFHKEREAAAYEAREDVREEIDDTIKKFLLELELCQNKSLADTLDRLFATL